MNGERLSGIDRGSLLAEHMLRSSETLRAIHTSGSDKEVILQQVISELENDPQGQANFLKTLIRNIAKAGNADVSDKRNGALAILTDTTGSGEVRLTETLVPLVEANQTVVCDEYIKAVQQQTSEPSSIDALLKTGKAIAWHLGPVGHEYRRQIQVEAAWRLIASDFPSQEAQNYILANAEAIKHGMSLDAQVEQLRNAGVSNSQIAERLGRKESDINNSIHRLITQGRVEKRTPGLGDSATKLLRILQDFRETHPIASISLAEMANQLGVSRESARQLYNKLHTAYSLPPKSGSGMEQLSQEYLERLDQEVVERTYQGMSVQEIAEALHVPSVWVKASQKRFAQHIQEQKERDREEFRSQVEALRNQGLGTKKIAEMLGKSVSQVEHIAIDLREAGKVPKMRRRKAPHELAPFDAQVEEMRAAGLTYQEMAQRLDASVNHILASVLRLIAQGRIEPNSKSRSARELDTQVEQLRGQGYTYEEMAEQLGRNIKYIRASVYRLFKQGRVERKQSRSSSEAIANLDAHVEQLRRQGFSNKEIAERLGKKESDIHSSVRRLISAGRVERKNVKASHETIVQLDADVEKLRKQGLSNPQIAEQLGRRVQDINISAHRLITQGRIEPAKSGRPKSKDL